MIEKFSVRKPFTVIVAVVLVLILGIVSFTKMKTDLLPNMNLPYVMVMTNYSGASPEEVEQTVTKPVEQVLASVSGLDTMMSQSNENVSIVALQFEDDANMDAVTLDIREKLDMVESMFPEEVGNSTILKLSMDMMPALVTAIDSDQMDQSDLSEYVNNTLAPNIESVSGVASVNPSGLLEENINVVINPDKIKAVNKKIKNAINGKFDDKSKELEDAEDKIAQAKNKLDSQRTAANKQIAKAKKALNDASMSVTEKEIQLTSAKMTLESKIAETKAQMGLLETSIAEAEKQYQQLVDAGLSEGQEAVALKTMIEGLKTNLETMKKTIAGLEKQKAQMDSALKQITAGKAKISGQLQTIDEQSVAANNKMASAEISITSQGSQIASGKQQITSAKETALSSANMTKTLTVDTVKNLLRAQNFSMPAGYVTEKNVQYLVRVGDEATSQKEVENLVLMYMGVDGIDPIRLKDVADVAVVNNAEDIYCKVNGNEGILLAIQKQSNYSAAEVSDAVIKRLDEIKTTKKGLHYTNLMDQGVYIDMIVDSVLSNLIFGAIFAIIVLFLFLKDIRPTIVVSLSIPISVVFAIVLMYFTGITLNIISLSGLALGVGMLVDNSIVVIENIYRLRKEGWDTREAAVEGARGVSGAIAASTLTTISVFLPIVFTTGLTRQLFTDMALTIGFSLIASLIVAVTVVPMMASGMLSKVSEKDNRFIDRVRDLYVKVIQKLLSKRLLVIVVALALFVGSIFGIVQKGFSLFPTMESTQMTMTMTMPKGSSQEDMTDMANTITEKTLEISDVETVGSMMGNGSMGMISGSGSSKKSVTMYLILKEDKKLSNTDIKKKIEEKTKKFDCDLDISTSNINMGTMAQSGVSVAVKGTEINKIRKIADQVANIMKDTEGLIDVSNGQEETTGELHIVVDKKKAIKKGLTVAQVYQAVAAELSDPSKATSITQNDTSYDVKVQKKSEYAKSRRKIKDLKLTGNVGGTEKTVKLSEIAQIKNSDSLSSIGREDQTRYLTVSASVKEGYNATKLSDKVEKQTSKISLPKGYSIETGGEAESIYEMMKQLGLMLLLAVVFMYLIMVAQFQSLLSPFIILFTIPLAFTGGLLGLLICGMDLSTIAMIGFVMLSGIIVNNGIVLVDTINQIRHTGKEKDESIVIAGSLRLRPILMTAMTTILGLSMMALGRGTGSEMAQPMAVVTIGGLIYGTLLTLVVIPCIYSLMNRDGKRRKIKRRFRRKNKE